VDYGDYVDQIANVIYLRFIASSGNALGRASTEEGRRTWESLEAAESADLIREYDAVLRRLSAAPEPTGSIFRGSESLIRDPDSLRAMLNTLALVPDKAANQTLSTAYEELLARAASEAKKGAGQYFTPDSVTDLMIRALRPEEPSSANPFVIFDPACGVGGFLAAAARWQANHRHEAIGKSRTEYHGVEIAARPWRLAQLNLTLHQMNGEIARGDALNGAAQPQSADIIITNPPFGTRGSSRIPDAGGHWYPTSNKQVNFLQHVINRLREGGRAAIVLPDSILAGEQYRRLWAGVLERASVHTLVRLPTGSFSPYAPSIKTIILFLTKSQIDGVTWVYDARASMDGSVVERKRGIAQESVDEFIRCFGADPMDHGGRAESEAQIHKWYPMASSELFLSDRPLFRQAQRWKAEHSELRIEAHLQAATKELESALGLLRGFGGGRNHG
jgi:type I restriction enzyme M protein